LDADWTWLEGDAVDRSLPLSGSLAGVDDELGG
jgi:hypothetical protein